MTATAQQKKFSDAERIARTPKVLRHYAKDIQSHKPLDSDCHPTIIYAANTLEIMLTLLQSMKGQTVLTHEQKAIIETMTGSTQGA